DVQGKELASLSGHQDGVNSAAFSPDSQKIVTASDDKTAKVWDVQGKELASLSGHQDGVNSAAFSPDSQKIVTASDDKTVKVWNIKGKLLATLKHQDDIKFAVFSQNGSQIVTATKHTVKVWQDFLVDKLLKSNRFATLTLADQVLAGVITLEELSAKQLLTKEVKSNRWSIAQYYEDKADQSSLIENRKKYLQQAAIFYEKLGPLKGQEIKSEMAKLAHSEPTESKSLEELSEPQQSVVVRWKNIPLIIFAGLVMLVISRQQKVFFQHRQYLRLVIYSIVPMAVLVNWLSFRDGSGYFIHEYWSYLQAGIYSLMVLCIAGICFFQARQRFQHKRLRILLQLFCLVLFVSSIGVAVFLFLEHPHLDGEMSIEDRIKTGMAIVLSLLPIYLTYYALQSGDKWKWLKNASILLSYAILFFVVFWIVGTLDNALAFHKPIPKSWQFLLLFTTGAVLARALFFQFKACQKQKWLTMGSFALVYSVILYFSLIGLFNEGFFSFPSYTEGKRIILYSEVSDALTLLLALIAAGFAAVWGIQAYQSQRYRETGMYLLSVIILVSITAYYFHAYMPMVSFFMVVFGGILLLIHVVSRAFDKPDRTAGACRP
ncbi:MAG: hypothetical protein GY862_22555, partial [Gammaproteobacteria bacterium]|nr:hypothetical protein [Gammaproteobacteria bacterium]